MTVALWKRMTENPLHLLTLMNATSRQVASINNTAQFYFFPCSQKYRAINLRLYQPLLVMLSYFFDTQIQTGGRRKTMGLAEIDL